MKPHEPFQFLVIGHDKPLVNELLSSLRHDKYSIIASGLNTVKSLKKYLQKNHADILLLIESPTIQEGPQIEDWLACYKQLNCKIPLFIISAKESSELSPERSGFNKQSCQAKGVSEVIPRQNIDHLLSTIKKQLALCLEIKAHRKLARQIHALDKQQQVLLDNNQNAIAMLDKGKHCYCNDKYLTLFSCANNRKLLNTSILDLVSPQDKAKLKSLIFSETKTQHDFIIEKVNSAENRIFTLSFTPATCFKGENYLQVTAEPAKGNSQYSKEKNSLASQDILTRLENLDVFTSRVEYAIAQAIDHQVSSSLLIVQIEQFDQVLERLGKTGTNQVLYEISEFLNSSINTPFTASRMAENEFGLLLHECAATQGQKLAEFIHAKLNGSLPNDENKPIGIRAALGMAVINNLALDAEDMIDRARINRIFGPQSLPDSCVHGDPETNISDLIIQALDQHQIDLLFQPLVPFQADEKERYEVRMCLNNEQGTLPEHFFHHANLHNLAGELDKTVLRKIFQEQELLDNINKQLYIHISGNSLVNKGLLAWLSKAIQQYRVPTEQLTFQISEIDLQNNWQQTLQFSQSLSHLGIRQSITRFGSVMEAIPALSALKPDSVKLDDALVKDILYSKQQQIKIRKLIRAIHHKKAKVCIAGIEDLEMLPLLWDLGVDLIQGYGIQIPVICQNFVFPREENIHLVGKI